MTQSTAATGTYELVMVYRGREVNNSHLPHYAPDGTITGTRCNRTKLPKAGKIEAVADYRRAVCNKCNNVNPWGR